MFVSLSVHLCACLRGPEDAQRVTGSSKMPDTGTENQTPAVWKNIHFSYLLGHHSSHYTYCCENSCLKLLVRYIQLRVVVGYS